MKERKATGIKSWPEDDRPREKLLKKGAGALSNSELLAILLRTGTAGTSAIDLARKILKKFSTFRNMAHTDAREKYKTRSGGRFNTKLKCDILKSRIYLGKLVWNRYHYDTKQKTLKGYKYVRNDPSKVIVVAGRHEPIICQEDYDAVQKRLVLSKRGGIAKCSSKEYPLTGILICAQCGNRFFGCYNTATRKGGKTATKRRYYRCGARQIYNVQCDNSYVRANDIEAEVYKILEVIFSGGIDEARLQNLVAHGAEKYSGDLGQKIESVRQQLEDNVLKQGRLSGIYAEGLLAKEAYKKQVAPLLEEEADIRSQLRKLELSLNERERSEIICGC